MLRLLFAVAALTIAASGVFAGPENTKGQEGAERQQARDHSNEVHRMKPRENVPRTDSDLSPVERARERNRKLKEEKEEKELKDEEGTDSTD